MSAVQKNERRRDEMRRRRETLVGARDAAVKQLDEALASRDVSKLQLAVRAAAAAALVGDHAADGVGPGGKWLISEVRDAYLMLAEVRRCARDRDRRGEVLTLLPYWQLRRLREEHAASSKRAAELGGLSARAAGLGRDRNGRRYWGFEPVASADSAEKVAEKIAEAPSHLVWVQPAGHNDGGDWEVFEGKEACRPPSPPPATTTASTTKVTPGTVGRRASRWRRRSTGAVSPSARCRMRSTRRSTRSPRGRVRARSRPRAEAAPWHQPPYPYILGCISFQVSREAM